MCIGVVGIYHVCHASQKVFEALCPLGTWVLQQRGMHAQREPYNNERLTERPTTPRPAMSPGGREAPARTCEVQHRYRLGIVTHACVCWCGRVSGAEVFAEDGRG